MRHAARIAVDANFGFTFRTNSGIKGCLDVEGKLTSGFSARSAPAVCAIERETMEKRNRLADSICEREN